MTAVVLEVALAQSAGRASGVGQASAGSGWSSLTAWLVAGAAVAVLAGVAWWIAGPARRRGRGRSRTSRPGAGVTKVR